LPTLVLRSLTLKTVIGVYDWERVAASPLIFDLWLEAAQCFSVNREQMAERLRDWVAEYRYQLLEALAEHIAQKLISEFACQRVCIAIEKPGALGKVARVGIRITRYAVVDCPTKTND
jgi:dihydroneopterin aldolase